MIIYFFLFSLHHTDEDIIVHFCFSSVHLRCIQPRNCQNMYIYGNGRGSSGSNQS